MPARVKNDWSLLSDQALIASNCFFVQSRRREVPVHTPWVFNPVILETVRCLQLHHAVPLRRKSPARDAGQPILPYSPGRSGLLEPVPGVIVPRSCPKAFT